jgi:hypothetical protein
MLEQPRQSSALIDDRVQEENFSSNSPTRATNPPLKAFLWVAEIIDDKLPSRNDFRRTPCLNVNCSILTFSWRRSTISERIMLALGTTSEASYLQAKVLKNTQQPDGTFAVECEFTERYGA